MDEMEWVVTESETQSEVSNVMDLLLANEDKIRYDKMGLAIITSIADIMGISVTGGEFYKAKNAKILWDAYKEKQ